MNKPLVPVKVHLLLRARADELDEINDHIPDYSLASIADDLRTMADMIEAELPDGCRHEKVAELNRPQA